MSLEELKAFGWFVLDAFRPRLHFGGAQRENKVAYLDGLRGFAAFIVYWTHYTGFSHDGSWAFRNSFGWNDRYYFACFPGIRLIFHGGAFAVATFFVISGYVLSVSPLAMIHREEEGTRLPKQLGCSFPRRFVRLYIPVVGTLVVFFTIWHVFGVISGAPGHAGPRPNYISEWLRFFYEFVRGTYYFNRGVGFGAGNYNSTLWSIAAEFRGSTIIYVTLLTFWALEWGPTQRFWTCIGLFVYFLYLGDGPYWALFIMGLMLCDMDMLGENDPFHLPKILSHFKVMSRHRWLYYIPMIVGLYLASAPHVQRIADLRGEPGWAWSQMLIPSTSTNARWFLATWGAILFVISIPRIAWLRKFFETQFCQYLGKVSFGFYLVHGPVIWTVGDRLLAAVGRPHHGAEVRVPGYMNLLPLSNAGPLGLEISAVAPQLILLPVTLYLAGVVTKLFDEPSVTISKWMFKVLLVGIISSPHTALVQEALHEDAAAWINSGPQNDPDDILRGEWYDSEYDRFHCERIRSWSYAFDGILKDEKDYLLCRCVCRKLFP